MDMFTLGALGANTATSLVSGLLEHSSTSSANRRAQRMQKEAQDYNTMMWLASNEYNSPKNQMERLREAGLNPQLALGGLGNTATYGGGGLGVASTHKSGMGSIISNYADKLAKFAQLRTLQSESELMSEKINTEKETQAQLRAKSSLDASQSELNDAMKDFTKLQVKDLENGISPNAQTWERLAVRLVDELQQIAVLNFTAGGRNFSMKNPLYRGKEVKKTTADVLHRVNPLGTPAQRAHKDLVRMLPRNISK